MYPTHLGVQPLEAELVWGGGVPAAEADQQQLLSGQGSLGHLVRTLVWPRDSCRKQMERLH